MARRKRITASEWVEANPYPDGRTSCDHCGSVVAALTKWSPDEINQCGCACHWAKRYDKENKTK